MRHLSFSPCVIGIGLGEAGEPGESDAALAGLRCDDLTSLGEADAAQTEDGFDLKLGDVEERGAEEKEGVESEEETETKTGEARFDSRFESEEETETKGEGEEAAEPDGAAPTASASTMASVSASAPAPEFIAWSAADCEAASARFGSVKPPEKSEPSNALCVGSSGPLVAEEAESTGSTAEEVDEIGVPHSSEVAGIDLADSGKNVPPASRA